MTTFEENKNKIIDLSTLSESLGNLGKVTSDIEKLVSAFNAKFDIDESQLKKLFSANSSLKKEYEELINLSDRYKKTLEDISKKNNELADIISTDSLTSGLSLTTDELTEAVEYFERYKGSIDKTSESYRSLSADQQRLVDVFEDDRTNILPTFQTKLDELSNSKKGLVKLDSERKQILSRVNAEYAKTNVEIKKSEETLTNVLALTKLVWGEIKSGGNKWIEIDDKLSKVGRTIGLSTQQIRGYQKNVLENYGSMAQKLGMTFEELFKFQEQYSKNTGRAVVLTNQQTMALASVSKMVGETATEEMVKNMDDFGASTQTATSYLALNMARARSQGLDAQKASETFAKNVKLASKYTFREGVNGISKMTLLSQKLKFNMDSIANAAEKFQTVEGAIETAAKLQMLGGSFTMQFANPLEAMNMSLMDFEGFTDKIIDSFSNLAYFDRQTGQVNMSPIDKQRMKHAANELGLSYEDVWNIASQKAKIGDIQRQLRYNTDYNSFSEEEKSFIESKAQYNATTKNHYITYYHDGKEVSRDIDKLSPAELKIAREQTSIEKMISTDVHNIHDKLNTYIVSQAQDNKTLQEAIKGNQEWWDIGKAKYMDFIMNPIKEHASTEFGAHIHKWGGTLLSVLTTLGVGKYIGNRLTNGATNTVSKTRGLWGRIPKFGKIGVGLAIATGLGTFLMSAADGSQVDRSKLGGREYVPGEENKPQTTNETETFGEVSKSSELSELEKQTVLLQLIAEKQGVNPNKIIQLTSSNPNEVNEAGTVEGTLGFAAGIWGDKIYNKYTSKHLGKNITNFNNTIGSKIDKSLIGKKINDISLNKGVKLESKGNKLIEQGKKIGGRKGAEKILKGRAKKVLASKVATSLATKGLAGPAGWAAIGADLVNFGGQSLGLWKEGSHTDKLINIGSKTASYAGIGAMIAGPVGAAVGGAVGLVTGTIQQYGKEIKEFGSKVYNGVKEGLFGSDNMSEEDKMQQSYEETKLGFVDITDPQLEQKAYIATCKIHDVVISMWHHMNGKQSNGLEKDNGLLGGLFNYNKKSNVVSNINTNNNGFYNSFDYSLQRNGYIASSVKMNDNYIATYNNKEYDLRDSQQRYEYSKEKLLNTYINNLKEQTAIEQQLQMLGNDISVKTITYNDSIIPKVSVGLPTQIRETSIKNQYNNSSSNIGNNKIDLNINGSIKLTTDKGLSSDLDINRLLVNPEFIRQITSIINNRLILNGGFGGLNKESMFARTGGFNPVIMNQDTSQH